MTGVPEKLIEVAEDLYEAAALEAAANDRTPRQQLEHWARVGRAVTSAGTGDTSGNEEAHDATYQTSSATSPAETNAELGTQIAAAVDAANFGAMLAARGMTTVALDDEGRLVEHRPDGSTSFL